MYRKYKEIIEFQIESDRQLFESLEADLGKKATVYDYHDLYSFCLDSFPYYERFITFEFDSDEMINLNPKCNPHGELADFFRDFKKKLDEIFNYYAGKIEVKTDMKIKIFPENIIDKEKNMLNYLSENYYIQKDMNKKGKFPIGYKRTAKDLVRQAYKFDPDINHKTLSIFINLYIDTNVEFCHIQNYCRELKKDIPIKNV